MATYLPVIAVSRSQSVRLGRGPGSAVVNELNMGDLPINPQTGALITLFYANLSDPWVRKDYQHHAALGSIDSVGTLSMTVASDLFAKSGIVASAGTGLAVNVSAGVLAGRTFGGSIDVNAVTGVAGTGPLAVATPSTIQSRIDVVYINPAGQLATYAGTPGAAQAFEVDSVASTGSPTGGTFTLTYTYNGQTFTTQPIAYNAAATAVASAVQAAGNLPGTLTGTGGPVGTGAVTLTASGALTGTFSGLSANYSGLTGGTTPTVTYTQTTAGVQGPVAPTVGGACQVVATYTVAANATGPSNFTQVIPTS